MAPKNERNTAKPEDEQKSSLLWRIAKWGLLTILFTGLLAGGTVAGLFYYYSKDLPRVMSRSDYDPAQTTRIYSSGGELIGEFSAEGGKRTVVPLEQIPNRVQYAFIAAEDASFREHGGIDYLGMLRAIYKAVRYNDELQGTSTITQQVVKNVLLTPDRTIERKIKEIILARELEQNLSKDDILFMYLNTIYLGHGNHGIEEAARFYFGKHASEITVSEAALLAGLTSAPANYTPVRHPEKAKARRHYVLKQLHEKGFIDQSTFEKADNSPIDLTDPDETHPHVGSAPYFVRHVREKLIEKYGKKTFYKEPLRVETTLDIDKQKGAKESARRGLRSYDTSQGYYEPIDKVDPDKLESYLKKLAEKQGTPPYKTTRMYRAAVTSVDAEKQNVRVRLGPGPKADAKLYLRPESRVLEPPPEDNSLDKLLSKGDIIKVALLETEPGDDGLLPVIFEPGPQSAVVSIDPKSRDVVAMVGGYSYEYTKFNHAIQANRQTGSTFKPFVYGAALSHKIITPATIYLDSPAVFQLEKGKNWSPHNSDGEWRGPVRIREGLGASRNVVAVRVLKEVGIPKAQKFARKAGIESDLTDDYTMVMGTSELSPLELTNAYATLASGGKYAEPQFIRRVENRGKTLDTFSREPEQVIDPAVNFLLVDLMRSVVEGYVDSTGEYRGGTGHRVNELDRPTAGKTGTTNETRDAWFVGFTPKLVTGAWVGFGNNKSLGDRQFGGKVAGPIWLNTMKKALSDVEPGEFEKPDEGLATAHIDPKSGKLARSDGIEELFLEGTAPTEYAPRESGGSEKDFLLNEFESSGSSSDSSETAPKDPQTPSATTR